MIQGGWPPTFRAYGLLITDNAAINARDVGSIPNPVNLDSVSPTARHRCDVSGVLSCVDQQKKTLRLTPPLATRFGAIPRV